jgi:hypothetical protein
MTDNLLKHEWKDLDSAELMLLLYERIGRPGQYDESSGNSNKFYLPLARASCQVSLTFREKKIVAIEPGEAFDAAEWMKISKEIEESILAGPQKVGRDYSFNSFRVLGSWRGNHSGVQILPPPEHAPRANVAMADHPFILEFPIKVTDCWPVTNHRRMREHRNLTLLLNVLLAGHTSLQSNRSAHFWASVPCDDGRYESKWVQKFFFAELDKIVRDDLSPPADKQLEEVEPEEYYTKVGHDGKGLRVSADLDQSICCYIALSKENRVKFDRATFWMEMASRQWDTSVSVSFAALVSAIESLTERGDRHRFNCPICRKSTEHEVPGATEKFRAILEEYAPGDTVRGLRNKMYDLRSRILHGSELMQLDQDFYSGWAPPGWNETELNDELWGLTRMALRKWLRNPPTT